MQTTKSYLFSLGSYCQSTGNCKKSVLPGIQDLGGGSLETQIFQVPLSSDSPLHQCPFIIFYFTLIPLSQLHSQTPQSYPVLFSDTIPFTIAGSPSGNIHRVLLCFHPQRTKHTLSAQDDLFQTKEKQQHERIKAESPGESAVCASPLKQG